MQFKPYRIRINLIHLDQNDYIVALTDFYCYFDCSDSSVISFNNGGYYQQQSKRRRFIIVRHFKHILWC